MAIEKLERARIEIFASYFAGAGKGFSLKEILSFSTNYSKSIKPLTAYSITPKREELFTEVILSLPAKEQFYALDTLIKTPLDMKYSYPTPQEIHYLTEVLYAPFGSNPIGLKFSHLMENTYREDWITASNKIISNPAEAITSARTMLETLCRTILNERGMSNKYTGELSELLKDTEQAVGLNIADYQNEHQFIKGIASIVNALSTLSNSDGNRHGQIAGVEITDPKYAELAVNLCGSLGIFILDFHHFNPLSIKGTINTV